MILLFKIYIEIRKKKKRPKKQNRNSQIDI